MIRESVVSSQLRSVGYDEEALTLEVEFQKRGTYRYFDVPANVHVSLMSAQSKGRYFNSEIRNRYRCKRTA
jgi:hypothetical protein